MTDSELFTVDAPASIANLPDDILNLVFNSLCESGRPCYTVMCCMLTCRRFRGILSDRNRLWVSQLNEEELAARRERFWKSLHFVSQHLPAEKWPACEFWTNGLEGATIHCGHVKFLDMVLEIGLNAGSEIPPDQLLSLVSGVCRDRYGDVEPATQNETWFVEALYKYLNELHQSKNSRCAHPRVGESPHSVWCQVNVRWHDVIRAVYWPTLDIEGCQLNEVELSDLLVDVSCARSKPYLTEKDFRPEVWREIHNQLSYTCRPVFPSCVPFEHVFIADKPIMFVGFPVQWLSKHLRISNAAPNCLAHLTFRCVNSIGKTLLCSGFGTPDFVRTVMDNLNLFSRENPPSTVELRGKVLPLR